MLEKKIESHNFMKNRLMHLRTEQTTGNVFAFGHVVPWIETVRAQPLPLDVLQPFRELQPLELSAFVQWMLLAAHGAGRRRNPRFPIDDLTPVEWSWLSRSFGFG